MGQQSALVGGLQDFTPSCGVWSKQLTMRGISLCFVTVKLSWWKCFKMYCWNHCNIGPWKRAELSAIFVQVQLFCMKHSWAVPLVSQPTSVKVVSFVAAVQWEWWKKGTKKREFRDYAVVVTTYVNTQFQLLIPAFVFVASPKISKGVFTLPVLK